MFGVVLMWEPVLVGFLFIAMLLPNIFDATSYYCSLWLSELHNSLIIMANLTVTFLRNLILCFFKQTWVSGCMVLQYPLYCFTHNWLVRIQLPDKCDIQVLKTSLCAEWSLKWISSELGPVIWMAIKIMKQYLNGLKVLWLPIWFWSIKRSLLW